VTAKKRVSKLELEVQKLREKVNNNTVELEIARSTISGLKNEMKTS
jgi:hypothetical protein